MLAAHYSTKKALKESVGQPLKYAETSPFGEEYRSNGTFPVVGPTAGNRKWYAQVTMENGFISKVT